MLRGQSFSTVPLTGRTTIVVSYQRRVLPHSMAMTPRARYAPSLERRDQLSMRNHRRILTTSPAMEITPPQNTQTAWRAASHSSNVGIKERRFSAEPMVIPLTDPLNRTPMDRGVAMPFRLPSSDMTTRRSPRCIPSERSVPCDSSKCKFSDGRRVNALLLSDSKNKVPDLMLDILRGRI